MPRTPRLLLSAALLSCLLGRLRPSGRREALRPAAPGPTAPPGHETPEVAEASPVRRRPSPDRKVPLFTSTHRSHDPGEECEGRLLREPEGRPEGTAVFAPPSKTTLLHRGDPQGKRVALTFEGSPVPDSTSRLVALLRAYEAKATFFIVGEQLEGNRYYVDGIVAEKHLIGNQTMAGRPLAGLSREEMSRQIKTCDDLLEHIVGQLYDAARTQMRLLRPPEGRSDSALMEVAEAWDIRWFLWSVDGTATNTKGERLAKRVCSQMKSGSIVRLQDGPEATARALRRSSSISRRGLRVLTVDEMLE